MGDPWLSVAIFSDVLHCRIDNSKSLSDAHYESAFATLKRQNGQQLALSSDRKVFRLIS